MTHQATDTASAALLKANALRLICTRCDGQPCSEARADVGFWCGNCIARALASLPAPATDTASAALLKEYDWMPEARVMAAQCWCDEDTSGIEMDTRLAEAAARRIAAWMQTAAFHARNEEYYRGLVDACAAPLGEAAYICDDGSRSESVLRAKVPELIVAVLASLPAPAAPEEEKQG
jgi:hypothetical protein